MRQGLRRPHVQSKSATGATGKIAGVLWVEVVTLVLVAVLRLSAVARVEVIVGVE